MDDYTSTKEQVKRAYVTGMRQAFIASAGEHAEEFDRWLAEHDRAVAANAWEQGKATGESIQRRRWSDEPNAPEPTNPYRITEENN